MQHASWLSLAGPGTLRHMKLGLVLFVPGLFACNGSHQQVTSDGSSPADSTVGGSGADAWLGSDTPDPPDHAALPCTGTLRFPEVPYPYSLDSKPRVADLDGDGVMDLVVPNGSGIRVFLGKGNGVFADGVTYATTYGVSSIALDDVNGDGHVDVVAVEISNSSLSVLTNSGTGAFPTEALIPTGGSPVAVAIGDLTADGKPELVVARPNAVDVYRNLGSSFATPVSYAAGPGIDNVVLGDVTGDGLLDVVFADQQSNTIGVYANTGSGSLAAPVAHATGTQPIAIVIRDLTGDGKPDIAVTSLTSQQLYLNVFANQGSGVFTTHTDYLLGGTFSWPFAIGDIDGDGRLDVVAAGSELAPISSIAIGFGKAGGGFGPVTTYRSDLDQSTLLADFNGDGKLDILAGTQVMLNKGDGTFPRVTPISTSFLPLSASVADLDEDGNDDIIVTGVGEVGGIFFGDGHGGFAPALELATTTNVPLIGDIDGNGTRDVVIPDGFVVDGPGATIWRGSGRNFTSQLVALPKRVTLATLVDLDHDGRREIVSADDSELTVLKMQVDGTFVIGTSVPITNPRAITSGDVNGDGNLDVVVAKDANLVTVFLGDGAGGWSAQVESSAYTPPTNDIAVRDLDGDGKADLIIPGREYPGLGDGSFGTGSNNGIGARPRFRDIDGDGHIDVVSSNGGVVSVDLGVGDGTFRSSSYLGGDRRGVAVGDFDHDGRLDLVTAADAGLSEIDIHVGSCLP